MTITIRKGEGKDFPVILGMIKELAAFEKASRPVGNSLKQMEKEKKLFNFFVAEKDGEIVGYALYFFAYYTWVGKSLYLDDLYVKPDFRGKKVGSMLVRKIFEAAKKEDCNRVRLQALNWNSNAISIYLEWGGLINKEWINCDFDKAAINRLLKKNSKY